MLRWSLALVLALFSLTVAAVAGPKPVTFGVAAHSDVNIEWWYFNSHVTTDTGRHLALVGAFFRFGDGVSPFDPLVAVPRAHYLIYAVTDLDRKTHQSYSVADRNMVTLLKQVAPLLAAGSPDDRGAQALLNSLTKGKLPPGNTQIPGKATVTDSPFQIVYGAANTIAADNSQDTAFTINVGSGAADQIHLTLTSEKPPMAVGGNGETGLSKPTDMYYYSLTRCAVQGTVDTGAGTEKVRSGIGWFDHQWGNSWVAQNDGWDWFGVQLENGTDILFFRQRNLSTGRVFFPLATFMNKAGKVSVTKDVIFTPDASSNWTSPVTGVTYPLSWTVRFPTRHMTLQIKAAVKNQEMQILGPGGGIWEGACTVHGTEKDRSTPGVAYMELVGYNSPVVKAMLHRAH